jgi:predicted ATP-grasp superfamily ATP-dependent carboligase
MRSNRRIPEENDPGWARWYFLEVVCGGDCHERIKEALTEAGFNVRSIEKFPDHDYWEVKMKRATANHAPQYRLTNRQVRAILEKAGVNVAADEIIIDQKRGRILCAILYAGGSVGVWT